MTTMTTPLWSLIIRPSNGMINYSEFLMATLGLKTLDEVKLRRLFDLFDAD